MLIELPYFLHLIDERLLTLTRSIECCWAFNSRRLTRLSQVVQTLSAASSHCKVRRKCRRRLVKSVLLRSRTTAAYNDEEDAWTIQRTCSHQAVVSISRREASNHGDVLSTFPALQLQKHG